MRNRYLAVLAPCVFFIGCAEKSAGPSGSGQGRITYSLPNGDQYRIEAKAGATPENVSTALDALSPGPDEWINISPDGAWLLLSTERFDADCAGYACLAIVKGDLMSGEAIQVAGNLVHATGYSAVASGGNVVVYEDAGSAAHARDLWVITKTGGTWGAPAVLSGSSPFQFNSHPSFSADGSKIVFDCGNEPYGAEGTAICEVGTNGSGFRVAVRPSDSPPGMPDVGALHHAAFAADGSILFEADWAGEQIWRLAPSATTPVQVSPQVTNDNSPCVLPDGRVVSLWLSRAGNSAGLHELKVMSANGAAYFMALTLVDVVDIGIACGS